MTDDQPDEFTPPAPNVATLWGRAIVDELVASGVTRACVAPGSRSTPLTVALAEHEAVTVDSVLDERSAAYVALGRARVTGDPVAVVTTSGTATANLHPAVLEADRGRVPLLALTADRPAELQDSGANQTVDQRDLYGDAVRYQRTLPEPAAQRRRLRATRTTVCRAVAATTSAPAGPVHLNVPLAKPLEPTPASDLADPRAAEVPADFPSDGRPLAWPPDGGPRDEPNAPAVTVTRDEPTVGEATLGAVEAALASAERPLVVAGPATPRESVSEAARRIGAHWGVPVLADPLSGARFPAGEPGTGNDDGADPLVLGGYDGWLATSVPDPDVVVRLGMSPTSKRLRHWLRDAAARQFVVDPAGGWREATFTATDLVVASPRALADGFLDGPAADGPAVDAESAELTTQFAPWADRLAELERAYWNAVDEPLETSWFEGAIAAAVRRSLPAGSTLFLGNSMPVRDVDRFARPDGPPIGPVVGNRGVSGIDGTASTAIGAATAADGPTVALLGDLATIHDAAGLLAARRCGADLTVVVVNNDGGGIFHELPIASFDPPFTEQFLTPHGRNFDALADFYDAAYERVSGRGELLDALEASLGTAGLGLVEVSVEAAQSHAVRHALDERVADELDDLERSA